MMKRPILLAGALLLALAVPAQAKVGTGAAPGQTPAMVWKGLGNGGMGINVGGYVGGTNWSNTLRTRHVAPVQITSVRFVWQTFVPIMSGGAITDTPYANSYNFQGGIEYPYVAGNTGIPANRPKTLTCSQGINGIGIGSDGVSCSYAAPSAGHPNGNPAWVLISDPVPLSSIVPAFGTYGVWNTIENAAGVASASNTLPANNQSNYVERYSGYIAASSSLISSGETANATSIPHIGNGVQGYQEGLQPAMLLVPMAAGQSVVALQGDCLDVGTGSGTPTTITTADASGNANGDLGWPAIWVCSTLGLPCVNTGIGTDKWEFYTATTGAGRLTLDQISQATNVLDQLSHNTIAGGATLSTLTAAAIAQHQLIKNISPRIKITLATATPSVILSSDQYQTVAGQSVQLGWGPGSVAANYNAAVRSNPATFGADYGFDAAACVESGVGAGSFVANGTPYWVVYEGVHVNDNGQNTIANCPSNANTYTAGGL